MAKKNLILVPRGPQYENDFREIGKKILAIDREIIIHAFALSPDEEIERRIIATQGGEKDGELVKEPDIIALAERVGAAFPRSRCSRSTYCVRKEPEILFVLECNRGGNTWHFSSSIGEKLRLGFGNAAVNGLERAHKIARRMFME